MLVTHKNTKDEEGEENTEKNDHTAQLFWSLGSGESP